MIQVDLIYKYADSRKNAGPILSMHVVVKNSAKASILIPWNQGRRVCDEIVCGC